MNIESASVDDDKEVIRELGADPEYAIAYLTNAMSSGEQVLALLALRRVAEAYGMAHIAEAAQVNRENLYRAFSPKGNPRMKTVMAVFQAIRSKRHGDANQRVLAAS